MTSISRRFQIGNILIIVACGMFSSIVSVDRFFVNNLLNQQQYQRIALVSPNVASDPEKQESNVKSLVSEITTDAKLHSHDNLESPFPRWRGGIPTYSLLESIRVTLSGSLRFDRAHTVYIIDEKYNMFRTHVPRPKAADQAPYRRSKTMESFAIDVLKYVQTIDNTSPDSVEPFPYLRSIIKYGSGFAYIANYADSKFCGETSPFIDDNWNTLLNDTLVPIFALSSPIHCLRAFPTPTYETIEQADVNWKILIPYFRQIYPRSQQYHQAVWRGGPTGNRKPYQNTRVKLCLHAIERPDILDAKIVKQRKQWDYSKNNVTSKNFFNESQILGDKIPMIEFQKYRAIVDVDGHSWSSRFGELLCYSSVVLKVQPDDVDYFHPQLQPWVHYIPIQSNLSNLYEIVSYAISDDPFIVQIIQNANQWCLQHLNRKSLISDLAHIWDRYAYFLLLDNFKDTTAHAINNETSIVKDAISSLRIDHDDIQRVSGLYSESWQLDKQFLFRQYNFSRIYA